MAITEMPCPKCGENIKSNMVRCWNCGAFVKPEVEQAFLQRQAGMMQSRVGGGAAGTIQAGDSDFDLSPGSDLLETEDAEDGGGSESAQEYRLMPDDDIPAPAVETPEAEAPASADEAPQPADKPAPTVASAATVEGPATPHSVATAGDALLATAMQEEQETVRRKKKARLAGGGVIVFCPNGHRIQVDEKYRGKPGKCPQCKSAFFVPAAPLKTETTEPGTEQPAAAPAEASATGKYQHWVTDVRLHRVVPTKLQLKLGSVAGDYDTVDVGFSATDLLIATVFPKTGMFRDSAEKKKKPGTRQAMLDYLKANPTLDAVPVPAKRVLSAEQVREIRMAQPVPADQDSILAEVQVFGANRMAVRLPGTDDKGARLYLSFFLSNFREFSRLLDVVYQISGFGAGLGFPLEDQVKEFKCHYTDSVIQSLDDLAWYKADPALQVVTLGRQCSVCGLVVSEEARKKEKLGGKSGSGIAKAKCPKCKQNFGNKTLHGLKSEGIKMV